MHPKLVVLGLVVALVAAYILFAPPAAGDPLKDAKSGVNMNLYVHTAILDGSQNNSVASAAASGYASQSGLSFAPSTLTFGTLQPLQVIENQNGGGASCSIPTQTTIATTDAGGVVGVPVGHLQVSVTRPDNHNPVDGTVLFYVSYANGAATYLTAAQTGKYTGIATATVDSARGAYFSAKFVAPTPAYCTSTSGFVQSPALPTYNCSSTTAGCNNPTCTASGCGSPTQSPNGGTVTCQSTTGCACTGSSCAPAGTTVTTNSGTNTQTPVYTPPPPPPDLPPAHTGRINMLVTITGTAQAKNLSTPITVTATFTLKTAKNTFGDYSAVTRTTVDAAGGTINGLNAIFQDIPLGFVQGENTVIATVTATATDYAQNDVSDTQSATLKTVVDSSGSVHINIQPASLVWVGTNGAGHLTRRSLSLLPASIAG